ncbi:hypothetical protein A4X13_0g5594 [Tilletia indica]|uniref:Pali-domain-containing protein n=1 Tax=Tilletia indica TaxID=43049 RepID=A0A177T8C1_9BASI|nr:hypothetical protein A4X13_0g5594 [Tilletia indica]
MPGCASLPGILLLSAAAVLLIIVTFSTPSIKSVYYLEAIVGGGGSDRGRRITFGTLGYCLGNRCSALKLGYALTDANQLFGSDIIPAQYTTTLIKGLTYTLILQPIAAILTLVALLFALLSACPGCACGAFCGSFMTGLAATVTLVAFCLDLALFVIAKKRIDSIDGASATLGNALWIVAAAWGCLVVGAILVCCGACCGGGGGGGGGSSRKKDKWNSGPPNGAPPPSSSHQQDYSTQMRMDALAAERDRKNRQAAYERGRTDGGLPQFAEYVTEHEEVTPLTNDYDGRHHHQYAVGAAGAGVGAGAVAAGSYFDSPAQQPHHRQQSSTTGYPATYVPGVGQGYGEGRSGGGLDVPGGGGYGPGTPLTPSAASAVTQFYTPGEGPQPFRDGSYHDGASTAGGPGYGGAALAAAGAGAAAGYAVGGGHGAHGQSTQSQYDHQAGGGGYGQQDPYYDGQQSHPQPLQHQEHTQMPGGYDTYNYNDPSGAAGSSSAAQQYISAAPMPPPTRGLPEVPHQQVAGAGMSEKERMAAHYASQDAGGGQQGYYEQQNQEHGYALSPPPPPQQQEDGGNHAPHAAAVAHLESFADRMTGYPESGAGQGSGPPGYSAGDGGGYGYQSGYAGHQQGSKS